MAKLKLKTRKGKLTTADLASFGIPPRQPDGPKLVKAQGPKTLENAVVEREEKASMESSKDQDQGKGAVEQDQENQGGNTSMQGQLGHRDQNAELKNADSNLSG